VDKDTLKALWLAGYLHDLGKVAVPDGILLKPGKLCTTFEAVLHEGGAGVLR
jgi:HD-GYP domain-containing protein (c-di-GMP phosphodiesterase class II)